MMRVGSHPAKRQLQKKHTICCCRPIVTLALIVILLLDITGYGKMQSVFGDTIKALQALDDPGSFSSVQWSTVLSKTSDPIATAQSQSEAPLVSNVAPNTTPAAVVSVRHISLADRVRLVVTKNSSIMEWSNGQDFQPFLDLFPTLENISQKYQQEYNKSDTEETAKRKAGMDRFWGSSDASIVKMEDLCQVSSYFQRFNRTKPHVLVLHLNENWGAFSYYEPNRTAEWGPPVGSFWERSRCTFESMMEYLNHPNVLAVITTTHQAITHPKVWSIPLGIKLDRHSGPLPWVWKYIQEPSAEKKHLLTINENRVLPYRTAISDQIMGNFEGTLNRTNEYDRDLYYGRIRESKFVLCPSGIGYDTYRLWEVLYMGSIPVLEHTKGGGWEKTTEKLPVLWVDDFALVTPELLEREYALITARTDYEFEKLTKEWWANLVHSYVFGASRSEKLIGSSGQYSADVTLPGHSESDPERMHNATTENSLPRNSSRPSLSLADRVRMVVTKNSSIIQFTAGHNFQPFLDLFPKVENLFQYSGYYNTSDTEETAKRKAGMDRFWGSSDPGIGWMDEPCTISNLFKQYNRTKPHVIMTGLNENWGAFSYYEPNRTADWGPVDALWKGNGCTLESMMEYLNHPNVLAVITTTHQAIKHPKVWSIPLGIKMYFPEHTGFFPWVWKYIQEPSAEKKHLLTINDNRNLPYRVELTDQIIRNFGGALERFTEYDRDLYYGRIRESKFVLCATGIGYDTYRLWEVLYMGSIPILERTRGGGWEKTTEKLPVLWVDDFALVTPELLEREYPLIIERTDYEFEKLTKEWWVNLVHSYLEGGETPKRYR
jgi:hypothetical protein